MDRLDDATISVALRSLRWQRVGDAIETVRIFDDFAGSMDFVGHVAALAEARDHHPDIAISWNRVTLVLTTHSAGGLTDSDIELAAAIDALAGPGAEGSGSPL